MLLLTNLTDVLRLSNWLDVFPQKVGQLDILKAAQLTEWEQSAAWTWKSRYPEIPAMILEVTFTIVCIFPHIWRDLGEKIVVDQGRLTKIWALFSCALFEIAKLHEAPSQQINQFKIRVQTLVMPTFQARWSVVNNTN